MPCVLQLIAVAGVRDPGKRRQSGLTEAGYTLLNSSLLSWTAAVVRKRRDVFNGLHFEAGRFQGSDRAFAAAAWAFHFDFYFFDAVLLGFIGGLLRGHLAGERGALAASLEAAGAGTGPAQGITLGIGDRYSRVVERRLDVGDANRNVTTCLTTLALCHGRLSPKNLRRERPHEGIHDRTC